MNWGNKPTKCPELLALWQSTAQKQEMNAKHQASLADLETPVNEARTAHEGALDAENEHANQLYMAKRSRPKACGMTVAVTLAGPVTPVNSVITVSVEASEMCSEGLWFG